jgi:hypothetical protein
MAWTAPKTWSAVIVTVADLNTHIRDNLNFLKTAVDPHVENLIAFVAGTNDFAAPAGTTCISAGTVTGPAHLTGFSVAGATTGSKVRIVNLGPDVLYLDHQSASSLAANRMLNLATSAPTPLAVGGTADYMYDGVLRWRLMQHEQGAWITPVFAAGTFTGFGAMTWTVDAGDVVTCSYRLTGRTIQFTFDLTTTSVGGTPNVVLQIGNVAFGGFTCTRQSFQPYIKNDNAGGDAIARLQVSGGGTMLSLFNGMGAPNWTASTNANGVYGHVVFEVT